MTGGAPADDLPEVRAFLDAWGGPLAHDHPAAALEADLVAAAPSSVAGAEPNDPNDPSEPNEEPTA
jgi:hypothetical protein